MEANLNHSLSRIGQVDGIYGARPMALVNRTHQFVNISFANGKGVMLLLCEDEGVKLSAVYHHKLKWRCE